MLMDTGTAAPKLTTATTAKATSSPRSSTEQKTEGLIGKEVGLQELAEQEGWGKQKTEEAELEVNKKLLAKVFLLKDIWRSREPKARRLFCDSFVMSLRADEE